MKTRLLACAVAMTGCFEEGGNQAQTEAAITIADSLVAFPELSANLTSGNIDAGKAADSLTRFIKMPAAANNLLEAPFDSTGSSARTTPAVPAELPNCVTTDGPSGCDSFTAGMCEGGGFTFNGTANRACTPTSCTLDPPESDVLGECTYTWSGLQLGFTNPELMVDMTMTTSGIETVRQGEVFGDLFFGPYELKNGAGVQTGNVRVCSCGAANVAELPQGLRLVNSSFVVKDFDTGGTRRCALVEFDGNGDPTSTVEQPEACACRDGTTCSGDANEPILI